LSNEAALKRIIVLSVLACFTLARVSFAQSAADSSGIRKAALDYIEGWYTGDAARMERALHPELAKRIVRTDSSSSLSRLNQMSALSLVQDTRMGGGNRTPTERQNKDVSILDIYRGAASARIAASDWIDYLHLAKWNDRWVIVNVLWELKPPSDDR
jgi:hypothetical protein